MEEKDDLAKDAIEDRQDRTYERCRRHEANFGLRISSPEQRRYFGTTVEFWLSVVLDDNQAT